MEVKVTWNRDPLRHLNGVANQCRNKVIRIAMNKAAAGMKAAVQAKVHSDSGSIAKSIRIKIKGYRGNWWAGVGVLSSFKRTVGRGKGKKEYWPAKYWYLKEIGSKHGRAQHFMADAFNANIGQYFATLENVLGNELQALLNK